MRNKKSAINFFILMRMFVFPYLTGYKARVFLTIFGIALGVAVNISIRSSSGSAEAIMKDFISDLSYNADLHVSAGRNGFLEDYYKKIRLFDGVENAYMSIEKRSTFMVGGNSYPILIIGYDLMREKSIFSGNMKFKLIMNDKEFKFVDLFSRPDNVIVSKRFAKLYDIENNDSVRIKTPSGDIESRVLYFDSGEGVSSYDNVIIMDISALRYYFNYGDKINRVDVILDDLIDKVLLKKNLIDYLGEGFSVKLNDDVLNGSDSLYRSFRINLTMVSFLAILVGIYLVFNTMNNWVMHNRKNIGILTALGISRRDLFLIFIIKAILFSCLGFVLGIIIGWGLTQFSIKVFIEQFDTGDFIKFYDNFQYFSFDSLMISFFVSLMITILATLIPAFYALKIQPINNIRKTFNSANSFIAKRRYMVFSFLSLLMAYVFTNFPSIGGVPIFGFMSNFLILFGFSLFCPVIVYYVIYRLKKVSIDRFDLGIKIAFDNIVSALMRNSITINTLMISFSLVISIMTLINSYYYTVNNWMKNVNNADISIVSGFNYGGGEIFPMKEDRIDGVKDIDFIKDVDFYRFYESYYGDDKIEIHSFDVSVAENYARYTFIEGDQETAFWMMKNRDAVIISNEIARKYGLAVNSTISIKTNSGYFDFIVAGVVINYLSANEVISIDRKTFKKFWNDSLVDIFKIYLGKNNNGDISDSLYKKIKDSKSLTFINFEKLRDTIFDKINKTFYSFNALEIITVIIALLGLFNALFISIHEKKREINILKIIGASGFQIKKIIYFESLIISIFSLFIALISGILTSLITVFIINYQTLGWYLEFNFPILDLLIFFGFILVCSYLIAYYPASKARNMSIEKSLKYE